MATQFSMLGIFNAALIAQGCEEILSENEASNEWRLLARNWPTIVEAELEDGAYHFTRSWERLHTRQEGKFGYQDSYILPPTALHVRHVRTDSNHHPDWTQDGTSVHIDSPDGCEVEIVTSPEPNLWGANFTRGVQAKLEAVILRAIKEEFQEALAMEEMAENHFQRARTASSKSRSAKEPYRGGRFGMARFGLG